MLALHHLSKNEREDEIHRLNGTAGLTGAVDGVLLLQREKREQLTATLTTNGRDLERQALGIEFNPTTCRWRELGNAEEVYGNQQQHAILTVLASNATPMTPKALAEATNGNASTIRSTLRRLQAQQLVISPSYGKYTVRKPSSGEGSAVAASTATPATLQQCNSATLGAFEPESKPGAESGKELQDQTGATPGKGQGHNKSQSGKTPFKRGTLRWSTEWQSEAVQQSATLGEGPQTRNLRALPAQEWQELQSGSPQDDAAEDDDSALACIACGQPVVAGSLYCATCAPKAKAA